MKGDQVLERNTDYNQLPVESTGTSTVAKMSFTISSDSAGTYTCRGTFYDGFCVTQQQFSSEGVVLSITTAEPLEEPASATAYGGESHTFSCKFPDAFGGERYEIEWLFKAVGASEAIVSYQIQLVIVLYILQCSESTWLKSKFLLLMVLAGEISRSIYVWLLYLR